MVETISLKTPSVYSTSSPRARRRGKGYQTLVKEFVSERRYEEEEREGIVGK
ncbi:MAG: hypothetical protein ACJ77A_01780 [Actinomycetota bacterium]